MIVGVDDRHRGPDGPGREPPEAGAPAIRMVVARVLTEVLTPVVLIVVVLLAVSIQASGLARGLLYGLVAATFAGGIPYAVIVRGMRQGRFGDHHLTRREERPGLMAFALGSVTTGLVVIALLGAPRPVFALVAAMVCGGAVSLAVTTVWKISIHCACVAGTVTVFVVVFGPLMLLTSPLIPAVAWARVTLREHTLAQTIAGAAMGAVVVGGVMAVLR